MKFRKLLLALALFVAVTATFAFKQPLVSMASIQVGPVCTIAWGYYTEQEICAADATGPQCTVLVGFEHYPAWQYGTTPGCSIPLYQFQ